MHIQVEIITADWKLLIKIKTEKTETEGKERQREETE